MSGNQGLEPEEPALTWVFDGEESRRKDGRVCGIPSLTLGAAGRSVSRDMRCVCCEWS